VSALSSHAQTGNLTVGSGSPPRSILAASTIAANQNFGLSLGQRCASPFGGFKSLINGSVSRHADDRAINDAGPAGNFESGPRHVGVGARRRKFYGGARLSARNSQLLIPTGSATVWA